jgi:hypothetical protein
MTTPDLTLLTITHRAVRHDAHRLHRAVQSLRVDERHGRGADLEQWLRGFAGEVRAHHAFEDTIVLPRLVQRAPAAVVHVARVDQDHKAIDDALGACAHALGDLADPAVPWVEARGWALAATSALAVLVQEHLDFTDQVILPAIAHYFSADAYAALQADAKAFRSVRQAMFSVPWILASVTAHEQLVLLGAAPWPVRAIWRLTRARYERLAERAFGAAELVAIA